MNEIFQAKEGTLACKVFFFSPTVCYQLHDFFLLKKINITTLTTPFQPEAQNSWAVLSAFLKQVGEASVYFNFYLRR
jgi:hypothetical protein